MKIYAVTKGESLDYWDDVRIKVFEDGEGKDLSIFWYYDVRHNSIVADDYPSSESVKTYGGEILGAYVYAKDKEHAEKKARDMIAEYKAKKDWIVIP